MTDQIEWEIFISYASADSEFAAALRAGLGIRWRTFHAGSDAEVGTPWDLTIPRAQGVADVTVVLVSPNTPAAFYQRAEIRRAIALHRANPLRHRVVPVYLDGVDPDRDELAFGVSLFQGLTAGELGGADGVVEALLEKLGTPCVTAGHDGEASLAHPLHAFPDGPMVEGPPFDAWMRQGPPEYVRLLKRREFELVVSEAQTLRDAADSGKDNGVVSGLPDPLMYPEDFWFTAFSEARKHGPRWVAALLLVVPQERFQRSAAECRARLLSYLSRDPL